MARSKQSKHDIVGSLQEKLKQSKSAVFVSVKGLKVSEVSDFRRKCRDAQTEVYVVKKTLLKRALHEYNITDVDPKKFEGEVGVVFGYGDEVSNTKVVADFSKKHEALTVLAGCMFSAPLGAQYLDALSVKHLAQLPSRQELLGSLVGTLANPMRGFVGVLQGTTRSLVYALNAIAQQKS